MQELSEEAARQATDRRRHERYAFKGAEVFLFTSWKQLNDPQPKERFTLRLKDMSPAGLSGLIDAPLTVGDMVFVQFEDTLIPAAEVIWCRRMMIGFALIRALAPARFQRLREAHEAGHPWSPAMRARVQLPNWPVEVEPEAPNQAAASRS